MKQQSETWHGWRDKGIGSSDAAIIMNDSPWGNLRTLYLEKSGRRKRKAPDFAQREGIEKESEARSYFELRFDKDYDPILAEHAQLPYIRASLDGWNHEDREILEIKAPGEEAHLMAVNLQIPEVYQWQIAHQFLVTDADKCVYGSYHRDFHPKGAVVIVRPDLEKIQRLLQRELWFWRLFQEGLDPALFDPERLRAVCAKKHIYADLEEVREHTDDVKKFAFKCSFCKYYHVSKKRMNARSRDILEYLE